MNTMYAAVSARTTEIGTLRALGFSPLAIMTRSLPSLQRWRSRGHHRSDSRPAGQRTLDQVNGGAVSAPTLAFNFYVTPAIAIQALVFAIVIGALGGWLPARQAMRVSVVNALRRN